MLFEGSGVALVTPFNEDCFSLLPNAGWLVVIVMINLKS